LFAPVSYTVLPCSQRACLVPFVVVALTALKPATSLQPHLAASRRWPGKTFPRAFTFFPFARFPDQLDVVATGGAAVHLVTSVLAAYASRDCASAAAKWLFVLYLGTLMIPAAWSPCASIFDDARGRLAGHVLGG